MAWERCPGASCSLPAACQLRLSYFWDLAPSLEKQTVALTVIPNKTPSFCSLNHVFQKSCPTGGLDAKYWAWESQFGRRGTFIRKVPRWKFPLHSKMASFVAKETYSVFKEETLANECPEIYALSYSLFCKSRAKFAFTKEHHDYQQQPFYI